MQADDVDSRNEATVDEEVADCEQMVETLAEGEAQRRTRRDNSLCRYAPAWPLPVGRKVGRMVVFGKNTATIVQLDAEEAEATDQPESFHDYRYACGPCWPMVLVTSALILVVELVLLASIRKHTPIPLFVIGVVLCLFVLFSFFYTSLTNPGIAPFHLSQPENCETWPYHEPSGSYRAPGTQWCSESRVFFYKFDHFCPWTGTAIAERNMPYFTGFVSCMCFTLFYMVLMVMFI
ncbi:Protein S-acyltransferase 8 [Diplonema papillatum]|nr:Protein S-acyltransferase 8 [Diplonema papillatum]